jgi:hypothetical protein
MALIAAISLRSAGGYDRENEGHACSRDIGVHAREGGIYHSQLLGYSMRACP